MREPPLYPEAAGEELSKYTPLPLPEKIGPYKIEALFSQGGMSHLFLGRDPETNQPIIVKVLLKKFLENSEVTDRFLREAHIIALADHPNIVKLHESGTWENGLYIAMEYLEGTSLREFLKTKPLPLKKAIEILLEIAYALCHLHTHQVIHRDLKPENILITRTGKVKVIDFGIAQVISFKNRETPQKKQFIGTPFYMSPEQRENPESVSYPSDLYSLGILAYELILGRPLQGQVHLALMPKGVQKILAKTLQPDPKERYSDVVDFIADLSEYLHSPQLEKDLRPQDHIFETFEKIGHLSQTLLEPPSPSWTTPEVKIIFTPSLTLPRLFWDFFEKDEKKGLLWVEAPEPTAESFIALMLLKGILGRSKELLADPRSLTPLLEEHLKTVPYAFCYLSVDLKSEEVYFQLKGPLELVKTSKGIATRVSDSDSALIPLSQGDTLLLYPSSQPLLNDKSSFEITPFSDLVDLEKSEKNAPYLVELKYFHGK